MVSERELIFTKFMLFGGETMNSYTRWWTRRTRLASDNGNNRSGRRFVWALRVAFHSLVRSVGWTSTEVVVGYLGPFIVVSHWCFLSLCWSHLTHPQIACCLGNFKTTRKRFAGWFIDFISHSLSSKKFQRAKTLPSWDCVSRFTN